MSEHTPINLAEEMERIRDAVFGARAFLPVEYGDDADLEPAVVDYRDLSTETLKTIADVLAEVSVRAEDLSESIIETVRERNKERIVEAFVEHVGENWPPERQAPDHRRLGTRARWYWCGIPDCDTCRKRGVIPGELDCG